MSEPEFHRDRREHGGASQRLDDDKLAELAEDERVEAGLDDYNADEVPPATDPLPPGVPEPPQDVRQGKYFELDLSTTEAAQAKTLAAEVADKLLANPVIESYRIEID